MLTITEVRQLSDRDLNAEADHARSLLVRQRMGVKTRHLKDTHLVGLLKTHLARLLTVSTERKKSGTEVKESDKTITTKLAETHKKITEHQTKSKKKTDKEERLVHDAQHTEQVEKEKAEADISEKSSAKVKVKKVEEKKGLLRGMFKKRDA